jgi:hypothetical protein
MARAADAVATAGHEAPASRQDPPSEPPTAPPPVVASAEYGHWARSQRAPGTVYGGPGPHGSATRAPAVAAGSPETSGSLTGHILAQGQADVARPTNSTARSIMRAALVIAALAAIGLLCAALAGGSVGALVEGLFGQ